MKTIKVPGEFSAVIGGRLADLEEQGLQEVQIRNRREMELIFFGDHRESEEREKFLDRFEPIGEMRLVRL